MIWLTWSLFVFPFVVAGSAGLKTVPHRPPTSWGVLNLTLAWLQASRTDERVDAPTSLADIPTVDCSISRQSQQSPCPKGAGLVLCAVSSRGVTSAPESVVRNCLIIWHRIPQSQKLWQMTCREVRPGLLVNVWGVWARCSGACLPAYLLFSASFAYKKAHHSSNHRGR